MQDFQDSFIRSFCLSITLGVIYGGPMLRNFELCAKLVKIFVFELTSIISNNGGRYTIPADDVIRYEQSYSLASSLRERDYLYPLREVVCSCNNELVSIR